MNSIDLGHRGFGNWRDFALTSAPELLAQLPTSAGVYCMRFPDAASRLRGESDIAYIGKATNRGGLRGRIRQYFHPGRLQSTNLATHKRLLEGMMLDLGYFETYGIGDADDLESELLLAFEAEHGERPPFNKQAALAHLRGRRVTSWAWTDGTVDPRGDHFELRYGSAEKSEWTAWVPVARVGPPARGVFPVQFIADRKGPGAAEMIEAVRRELHFYLIELEEEEPWKYAQYHCSTASNAYGSVHWSFFGAKGEHAPDGDEVRLTRPAMAKRRGPRR